MRALHLATLVLVVACGGDDTTDAANDAGTDALCAEGYCDCDGDGTVRVALPPRERL